jgi:hypothetical protein
MTFLSRLQKTDENQRSDNLLKRRIKHLVLLKFDIKIEAI